MKIKKVAEAGLAMIKKMAEFPSAFANQAFSHLARRLVQRSEDLQTGFLMMFK